ncbi:MAG: DUF2333 family protein [Ahrensia sp.]|nr:DUF2333 family protein [Ahrensia sp.]
MLDPIIAFFTRMFELIGRGIGTFIAWLLWPFLAFRKWLSGTGWFIKIPVFALLVLIAFSYVYLIYITQWWNRGDVEYANAYTTEQPMAVGAKLDDGTCKASQMVQASADLIDFNVNQTSWVPANPLSKAGILYIWDWKDTPFFDNKAAFQLGVNQVVRRTSVELVDRLGRVRGTSSINQNLQDAREDINYNEDAWVFTFSPPFVQPSTMSRLRDGRVSLLAFNDELIKCSGDFDARADNLLQYLDRVTGDIGSTSDILQRRIDVSNFTGFDARADDRFWFTYGQLYAYHGMLTAARSDFAEIVQQRNLSGVWDRIDAQLREALQTQPPFIVNGSGSSIVKSHLESIGFDLLRVRSNLVELRDILDR